jgi:hypothetical protein
VGSVGYGVMWELVRHGFDVRVLGGDPYLGAGHGIPRASRVPRLLVRSSGPGVRAPAGARRIAVIGENRNLAGRLRRAEVALVADLERHGARLTARGRKLLADAGTDSESGPIIETLSDLADGSDASTAWHRMLYDQTLNTLVVGKFVVVPAADAALLARFDRLRSDSGDSVLSVFVVPPPT